MRKLFLQGAILGVCLLATSALALANYGRKSPSQHTNIDDSDPTYANKFLPRPSSSAPTQEDAIENLFIAAQVLDETKYYSTHTTGEVKAKVGFIDYNQKVINNKIVNEDETFSESLSVSALKSVAVQKYITPTSFLDRTGSKISENGATWDGAIHSYTKEDYTDRWGNIKKSMTGYVLNDLSVLTGEWVKEENGNQVYSYTLETSIAPYRYQHEVKTNAGSKDYPLFSKIQIDVTMTNDWKVQSIASKETYQIGLFGANITCVSDLLEEFTYYDEPTNIPERSEFEPYFGSAPTGDDQKEKGAMDYLGEAFTPYLTSNNPLYLYGEVDYGATDPFVIEASIGLNSGLYQIYLNKEFYLLLQSDFAYVDYGNVHMKVPMDDIEDVIRDYLPAGIKEQFDFDNLASLLTSLDFGSSGMKSEMTKGDDYVDISLNVLEGLDLTLHMGLDSEDVATFQSIQGSYQDSLDFTISLQNTSPIFPEINEEQVQTLLNLQEVKNYVATLLEEKKMHGDISLQLPLGKELLTVEGTVDVNASDTSNIQASAEVNVTYHGVTLPLAITYLNHQVYFEYLDSETFRICLSEEEIPLLIDQITTSFGITLPETSEFDFASIDVQAIIDSLVCDENSFQILLNLSQFGYEGSASIALEGETLSLSCDYGSIQLTNGIEEIYQPTGTQYLTADDLGVYLTSIANILEKKSFRLNCSLQLPLGENFILGGGTVYLNLQNGLDFQANFTVRQSVDGTPIALSITKLGEEVYFSFAENYFHGTMEEFITFLQELNNEYQLGLDSFLSILQGNVAFDGELPYETIVQMISSIDFSKGTISLDVDTAQFGLNFGVLHINFTPSQNGNQGQLTITGDNLSVEVVLDEESSIVIENKEKYQTLGALYELKKSLHSILNNGSVQITIDSCEYLTGTIALNFTNSIQVDASLQLLLNGETIPVHLLYDGTYAYVDCYNIHAKMTLQELQQFVDQITTTFGITLPSVDTSSLDLFAIINSLKITEQNLSLSIPFNNETWNINWTYETNSISIESSLFQASVVSALSQDITPLENTYLNYEALTSYLARIEQWMAMTSLEANVNIKAVVQGLEIKAVGDLQVDWKDSLTCSANLTLEIGGAIKVSLFLYKVNDDIYLEIGTMQYHFLYQDVVTLLEEIGHIFGITLDTSKFPSSIAKIDDLLALLPKQGTSTFDWSTIHINSLLQSIQWNQDTLSFSLDLDQNFGLTTGLAPIDVMVFQNGTEYGQISCATFGDISIFEGQVDEYTLPSVSPEQSYQDLHYFLNIIQEVKDEILPKTSKNELGEVVYTPGYVELLLDNCLLYRQDGTTGESNIYYKTNYTAGSTSENSFIRVTWDEAGQLSIYAQVKLYVQVQDETTGEMTYKLEHDISLTVVDRQIYVIYNGVKMRIGVQELAQSVRYLNDTLKLVSPEILNPILDMIASTEGLESSILDSMVQMKGEALDITYLVSKISSQEESLRVNISNQHAYPFNAPLGTYGELSMNQVLDENGQPVEKLRNIRIFNVYTNEKERLDISAILDYSNAKKHEETIVAPSDADAYNDFSCLESLLKQGVKTANLYQWDIQGSAQASINAIGLINITLDINDLNVQITFNKDTKEIEAKIHVVIPQKKVVVVATYGNTLDILYRGGKIYIKDEYHYDTGKLFKPISSDTKTDYKVYDSATFLDDKVAERIVKLLHFGSQLENIVLEQINKPLTEPEPRFETVFQSFNGGNNTYQVQLNSGKLLRNSTLKGMTITLSADANDYLYTIGVDWKVIEETAATISLLCNLSIANIGQPVVIDDAVFGDLTTYTVGQ